MTRPAVDIGLSAESPPEELRLSQLIAALSYALDLSGGRSSGHAARTCLIGMRMADTLILPPNSRRALFYTLLVKDAGCSFAAARLTAVFGADDLALNRALALSDWSRPGSRWALAWQHAQGGASLPARMSRLAGLALRGRAELREAMEVRCHSASDIARLLGLPAETANALLSLDEHWDGSGFPAGLAGEQIPLVARIAGLAQVAELFASLVGPTAAESVVCERKGSWFEPDLVKVFSAVAKEPSFWPAILGPSPCDSLAACEPEDEVLVEDRQRLDSVAEAFAQVIDAKSPFTYRHSEGVAVLAYQIAEALGLPVQVLPDLRRAALLHDLGKLGISNLILDKRGPLTPTEMAAVRLHPALTVEILSRVSRFRELAEVAGSHHELLDGSGYHRGLTAERLPLAARILTVADITEAMAAGRPYRPAVGWEAVLLSLRARAGRQLCADCVEALASLPAVQGNELNLWCPVPASPQRQ